MNKILLTSICAAALTSAASAFTLDLSSLNGVTLGAQTIATEYGDFTVTGPGTAVVSGGVATLASGQALTIVYPSTVEYVGAFLTSSSTSTDISAGSTVQYLSHAAGSSISSVTFNPVPEPSSTALLGLGGLALILRRRK